MQLFIVIYAMTGFYVWLSLFLDVPPSPKLPLAFHLTALIMCLIAGPVWAIYQVILERLNFRNSQ